MEIYCCKLNLVQERKVPCTEYNFWWYHSKSVLSITVPCDEPTTSLWGSTNCNVCFFFNSKLISSKSVFNISNIYYTNRIPVEELRTVPTIVTARTFCASQDTWVSYGWSLLIQEYFCVV